MPKKIVKRKKLKFIPFLIVLIILGGLFFAVYRFMNVKISNIIITNTNYLNDDYILELSGVRDYPNFYTLNTKSAVNMLKKSPYIKDAKMRRSFYHILTIDIVENKPLYLDYSSNTIVFEDGSKVFEDEAVVLFRVPRLMNYVPDDKYEMFIKRMGEVDIDILGKIADIEYVPNEYDKERFVLYMDDSNLVYLTLTRFDKINYYNDVVGQLEGHRGILYLDSGNHFEIKE